jgi:hypothetical protein
MPPPWLTPRAADAVTEVSDSAVTIAIKVEIEIMREAFDLFMIFLLIYI